MSFLLIYQQRIELHFIFSYLLFLIKIIGHNISQKITQQQHLIK